jgi:hypothetical protein
MKGMTLLSFLEDELFKAEFRITEESLNRVKYSRIGLDVNGVLIERIVHIEREGKFAEVSDWVIEGPFLTGETHHLRSRPEIQTAILAIIA